MAVRKISAVCFLIDFASPKLGKPADDTNTLAGNVLLALAVKFGVEASNEFDILGDATNIRLGSSLLVQERRPGSSIRIRKSVRYLLILSLSVTRGSAMCV